MYIIIYIYIIIIYIYICRYPIHIFIFHSIPLVTGRPNGSMATKVFSRPGDTSQSAPKFCAGEGGTRDVRDVPREISMESCSKTIQKPMENSKDTHDLTCFFRGMVYFMCI